MVAVFAGRAVNGSAYVRKTGYCESSRPQRAALCMRRMRQVWGLTFGELRSRSATSETRMTGNSLSRWNETYLIGTTVTAWNSECKRIRVHAAIENHLDACAQPACMLG